MNTSIGDNSTEPTIYDISIMILNAQRPSNIWAIVVSLFVLITGFLQIATTILWKPLRKVEQCFIFAIAVTDCLKAISFLALAARRIIGGNIVDNQLVCMFRVSCVKFPSNIAFVLMISLSLERMLGLAFPIWYNSRASVLRTVGFVFSCLFGCCMGAALFVDVSRTKLVPVCNYGTSPSEYYFEIIKWFDWFTVAIFLGINVASCTILIFRWRQARLNFQTLTAFKNDPKIAALKTLTALLVSYAVSEAAATACANILDSSGFSDATRISYGPYPAIFEMLRGVFDFPLYVLMVREYQTDSAKSC